PAVPERDRSTKLAGRKRRQVALSLLIARGRLERERGERVREDRPGHERVAELLHQNHELDRPEPLAAVLLRDEKTGPVEVADLSPEIVAQGVVGRGESANLLRVEARGEKVPRRRLEHLLLVCQIEVHLNFGRPSTLSATM